MAAAAEQLLEYEISPMAPDEFSWVAKSWKLGLRFGPAYRHLPPPVAFSRINPIVDGQLLSPRLHVIVARDPRRELGVQTLFGFIAFIGDTLRYASTRRPFRRCGVCRALLATAPGLVWYSTRSEYDPIWERHGMRRR